LKENDLVIVTSGESSIYKNKLKIETTLENEDYMKRK
jgi:hypothetical protein